ncbi:hypothetical protein D3C80_2051950 [compost metagenome]
MCDRFDVGLNVHQCIEVIISLCHIPRGSEAVVRNLNGWGQDAELGRLSPVQDQRSHHDPGGDGRLRVLLR